MAGAASSGRRGIPPASRRHPPPSPATMSADRRDGPQPAGLSPVRAAHACRPDLGLSAKAVPTCSGGTVRAGANCPRKTPCPDRLTGRIAARIPSMGTHRHGRRWEWSERVCPRPVEAAGGRELSKGAPGPGIDRLGRASFALLSEGAHLGQTAGAPIVGGRRTGKANAAILAPAAEARHTHRTPCESEGGSMIQVSCVCSPNRPGG